MTPLVPMPVSFLWLKVTAYLNDDHSFAIATVGTFCNPSWESTNNLPTCALVMDVTSDMKRVVKMKTDRRTRSVAFAMLR